MLPSNIINQLCEINNTSANSCRFGIKLVGLIRKRKKPRVLLLLPNGISGRFGTSAY